MHRPELPEKPRHRCRRLLSSKCSGRQLPFGGLPSAIEYLRIECRSIRTLVLEWNRKFAQLVTTSRFGRHCIPCDRLPGNECLGFNEVKKVSVIGRDNHQRICPGVAFFDPFKNCSNGGITA